MSFLNNCRAPSSDTMAKNAREIFKHDGYDAAIEYLSECMSSDYKCPDICDAKAMEFYEQNAIEIEGE